MHGLQIGVSPMQTISRSQKWLFLVSPYLKPWDDLFISIIDASQRRVAVTLVLREAETRAKNEELAKPLVDRGVTVKYLDRLHAKLYVNSTPQPKSPTRTKKHEQPPSIRAEVRMQGACIRCCTSVSLNPERPFCRSCYESWVKYENEDYPEKHCHRCGTTTPTSMAKPLCRGCWASSKG